MCGISGYLNLDSGVKIDVLRKMNDVIVYRGPDDEGYALIGPKGISHYSGRDTAAEIKLPPLETAEGGGSFLGFGHRRLSILDLSPAGHQPMELPERKLAVVYNGEIYNYVELRRELSDLGYTFCTTCDTEILLKAYCEWGEDCLSHFNGMWGFAIWDGQNKKLFCARDRLGAKPFHYYHKGNLFLFGSELKQLCQTEEIPRHFDLPYMAANLKYHVSDYNDHTLIEGIYALRPGHKLTVQLSEDCKSIQSVNIDQYWKLEENFHDDLSETEWKRRVAEEISRSCQWRLRSDAPLAALLSGGLDSSCLVTEICGQLSDPSKLETFTSSYPGYKNCDEWEYADMVNKSCGCKGNLIIPDPQENIGELYERAVWHNEGYISLATVGSMAMFDEIHRRGYKVIINGQCGDETMMGYVWYYAHYFADLLRHGKLYTAAKQYRACSNNSILSLSELFKTIVYFSVPMVRDTRQSLRTRKFVQREVLNTCNKAEMRQVLYPKSLGNAQILDLTATCLPAIVRLDDRMYMSASIESRIPFMDYRYVELAMQVPPSLKIKNGFTKNIVREVFDSRMPKEITWRTNKFGFPAPVAEWRKRFPREYLQALIDNARTAPYFRMDALQKMLDAGNLGPSFFDFVNMEVFARQFDVS